MPAFRFFGGFLLLLAVVIAVSDLTSAKWAIGNGLTVSLARHWASLAPSSLAAAQKSASGLSPLLWDPFIKSLLAIPAWIWFGSVGAVLAWAGRRRRQVNIYVN